ncbi:uncharacterized protein LOC112555468 isoform X3 [Pomacea canaliculata]|uniref:uncharacterized protein LOC112555468 isoform X3 n=1 Tax=Pomacea canaliculata TaxID=400727 RepID=UPI000D72F751|nr:uncharacterized protein LOC112555468 isoform X3 [Pomacea canaliculata]XP_025079680.1 uncharacterized protein LOC112555468 isoform X3 [Pomacea canaliculata]
MEGKEPRASFSLQLSKMAVFQVILVAFFAMSWWDCAQSLEIEVQTDTESKSLIVNCSFDKPSSTTMAVLAIHIIKPSSQGEEESQDQVSDDKKKPSQLEDALATIRIGETKPKVKDDSGMGRFSVEGYINSSYPSACFLELNISNISAADAGLYQCRAEVLDSSFSFRTDWAETNVTVTAAEDEPQDVQWVVQIAELRDRLEAEETERGFAERKGGDTTKRV